MYPILIVEHSVVMRDFDGRILALGCKYFAYAVCACDACLYAREYIWIIWTTLVNKHVVLLADVMMPHLSGYEVCEKLRDSYGATALPILMISAKVNRCW